MSKFKKIIAVVLILVLTASNGVYAAALPGAVCVTDFVAANTGEDVADELQALIDANPNRTIYFPDGIYLVSHSLLTPADPSKSVDLQLSNYAVLMATDNFAGGAVVALGGKDPYNTTFKIGSNYSLTGGVIDGNDIADGVSIDSGRETKVQNTSIKHTVVGLRVKPGVNSGSADADVRDINIIGNGTSDSVGIIIEGADNTFTNIRIGDVYTGVIIRSGGNSLTNVHPLYQLCWDQYEGSCGFVERSSNNRYTFCYGDQFQTAFKIVGNRRSIYDNCYAYWWSGKGGNCTGFKAEGGSFEAVVTNFRIDFRNDTDNTVYSGPSKGNGVFYRLQVKEEVLNSNRTFFKFTKEGIITHDLSYVSAKDATTEAEGNVEHYHCKYCGKNFSDSEGLYELTKVTIDKLPKEEEPQKDYNECKYCGEKHEGSFAWLIKLVHLMLAMLGFKK